MDEINVLRGALEAVERILNRGGEADDVLRAVVAALHERFSYVAIRFREEDRLVEGPSAGREADRVIVPVEFQGLAVAELELSIDDSAFAQRVATLISPYCLALSDGTRAAKPGLLDKRPTGVPTGVRQEGGGTMRPTARST